MSKTQAKHTEVQGLIDGVRNYIREALDIMESGDYAELVGLDAHVAKLCKEVQNLPVGEAKDYMDALGKLSAQLDNLKTVMEEHKNQVQENINELGNSRQASHAYAKSGSLLGAAPADAEEDDDGKDGGSGA